MPLAPTVEQLIEDFQQFYLFDPMLWDQPVGFLTWWGRVVRFERRSSDEMLLEVDEQTVTFLLP